MRIKKGTGYNALSLPVASRLVLVAAPMEANFYSLACGGGGVCPCSTPILCSCSTTSSLTCSLPTSSSSMSRRSILPRFTASARIARAPIATAPAALAPTPKAPRAVHASPVATRAKATCAPNGGCSTRLAVRILCIVLSFLQPRSSVAGFDPFHHNHDATSRSPARNFLKLRTREVRREPHRRTSGTVKLHSWVTAIGQQGTEAETRRLGVLGLTYRPAPLPSPSAPRPARPQFLLPPRAHRARRCCR